MVGPKLAIVAGGGPLPMRLAETCRTLNRPVFVLPLTGSADQDWKDFPHTEIRMGAVGRTFELLADHQCREIVMAGYVKRPNFQALRPDLTGTRLLPRFVAAAARGDDAILRLLVDIFEKQGLRVVGADDVLDDLLTQDKVYGDISPTTDDWQDIQKAVSVIDALGPFDVGQAAVVRGGHVLAIEAAEGTDAMLDRCADIIANSKENADRRLGVLVKKPKPQQERRVDLPIIGVTTVQKVAKAGLCGIAAAAGGSLLMDEAGAVEAANKKGIFVSGFAPENLPSQTVK